jgi:hypothetical protein
MVREVTPLSIAPFYSGPGDYILPRGTGSLPYPSMIVSEVSVPIEQRILGPVAGKLDPETVRLIRRLNSALRNEPFELPQVPGPTPRWNTRRLASPAGDYASHLRESVSTLVAEAQAALGVAESSASNVDANALGVFVSVARIGTRFPAEWQLDECVLTAQLDAGTLGLEKSEYEQLTSRVESPTVGSGVVGIHTTPEGSESICLAEAIEFRHGQMCIAVRAPHERLDGWVDVLIDL